MSFCTLVIKNLFRRRSRSLLTTIGIAVGIGAVVVLRRIAWGFERTWVNVYKERGTDLIVTKPASRSGMPAAFSARIKTQLQGLPHVRDASGILSDLFSIE